MLRNLRLIVLPREQGKFWKILISFQMHCLTKIINIDLTELTLQGGNTACRVLSFSWNDAGKRSKEDAGIFSQ